MKTINFGIDLGTTNSAIAKYTDGAVEIFKNPIGQKQTLSSAVAFRGERVLVGDKARNLLEKDPLNVFTCFKRRMGTTDSFFIESRQESITPIALSAYVLRELKNFVHTGEEVPEVVITIPSSFDTIQSNATKSAGLEAGFEKVFLLQEPIAASLAFANKNNIQVTSSKKWLVYDFGGGTFDVALLEVNAREMNVLDNEGDNFLGGMDFDQLIVEKLVVPQLEQELNEERLWEQFKQKGNPYQKTYYELLYRAEEAKKELSRFETTEIEIDIPEKDRYTTVTISRTDFNDLIAPAVARTIALARTMLERNNCAASDIEKMVMVGGSTLIPYVREHVGAALSISIDTSVEPTIAVGLGAAHYAGGKLAQNTTKAKEVQVPTDGEPFSYEVFYLRNSKDEEELISVTLPKDPKISLYRIRRSDGGFDTGLVTVSGDISCFVDLISGEKNTFQLTVYDAQQQLLYEQGNIVIVQGKYNVSGQLLPNDVCLEIDDVEHGITRLEAIFNKNSVLPLKRTIYKTASKNILVGSDEKLQINIVEGDDGGLPSSGLSIGYIEIAGNALEKDLIKGTDIEIELSVSESRDLDITVFLNSCDQEFQNSFQSTERAISMSKIDQEINKALRQVEHELKKSHENYELLSKFQKIRDGLIELQILLVGCDENDSTDTKFKIDNEKQLLIKSFDQLTRHKDLDESIADYQLKVAQIQSSIRGEEHDFFRKKLDAITGNQKTFLNSGNKYLIKSKIKELDALDNQIFTEDSTNFIGPFLHYKGLMELYTDKKSAKRLIDEGEKALETKQYEVLKHVVYQLYALLPDSEKQEKKTLFNDRDKTGLN